MNVLLKKYLKDTGKTIDDFKTAAQLEKMFQDCHNRYRDFDIDDAFDICGDVLDSCHIPEEDHDEIFLYRMKLVGR